MLELGYKKHSEYHYAKKFIMVCHDVHQQQQRPKPLNFKLGLIFMPTILFPGSQLTIAK
jgi:hypothetical protein